MNLQKPPVTAAEHITRAKQERAGGDHTAAQTFAFIAIAEYLGEHARAQRGRDLRSMTAHDDTSGIDWDQLMATTAGALWPLPDVDTIPAEPEIPMPAELEEIAAVHDAQIETVFRMLGIPFSGGIVTAACRAVWAQISAAVMAHRREYIAATGAHTELDYYRQENDMPTQPRSTRGCQWIQLWAADHSRIIWDARTDVAPGEDQFEAAKQFMEFHEFNDLPTTVHSDTWTNRWSGRLIRHGDEYRFDGTHEFLRYLKHVPNPLLPVPPTRPVVAVISETKDRAAQIADCLGIDTPWLFGDGMADEFEGLRADRVLIDATSPIDANFAHVTRATSAKTPGCSISFVTVRNDRG